MRISVGCQSFAARSNRLDWTKAPNSGYPLSRLKGIREISRLVKNSHEFEQFAPGRPKRTPKNCKKFELINSSNIAIA